MQRFIQFNDEKIDSMIVMELADLVTTLTKNLDYEVEFGVHSYLDRMSKKIYVRHFWNHRPKKIMINGLKSDVYLRAIGNYSFTNEEDIYYLLQKLSTTSLKSFAKQLFMITEDLRLEEIIKRKRPGTKSAFKDRIFVYRKYFESQLKVNLVKSIYTDALFNNIFLLLTSDSPNENIPNYNEEINLVMPYIKNTITRFYETKSTKDTVKLCLELTETLEDILDQDMLNEYFHLPDKKYDDIVHDPTFDDLKRKDPLQNNDVLDKKSEGDEEVFEEEFRTWHRETSDLSKSFLQFDLDQGSGTDLLGEGVREGEAGDQALAVVQGSVQKTNKNDYSNLEVQEHKQRSNQGIEKNYGKENRFAYPIFLSLEKPTYEEEKQYREFKSTISSYQKKLKKIIEKTLEHKKIAPRTDLHFGRLRKKLLPFFTDENPRLFYKKQEPSSEIDAVFSLLVDCSASMYDKMEQTKLGITLFHEALKSVNVAHEVIGFWEDTNDATKEKQPNYFKPVIEFSTSLRNLSGPEIMQLQPEEDNRDGYAIRLMTDRLMTRFENQKFLLVFSDGEPAAFGYEQNGIVDTHEAVLQARKKGIDVINIFLSNSEIEESQKKILHDIYGNFSILVSNIEELPNVLFPILKKLLYKSIA
ncbi:VWA domain-containing protein [Heyndrickxia oleronia]|uniref:vWA domain-containing protein n=1 Tax=Heyndrickxia oleronia TaxID=38875 RepID=UPI0015D3AFCD|nr:VWA domain-containing protein [Heyndrickxia oleronia]MEC1376431.1 VWA domain-containing protein [Heyndrickxia oleronia]NYV65462.1 VWA domain-containing protein [Bacillus sp. Gen3]QQZ06931.1 VWA domain-containing protein [Heyndrickxia oleronia]